MEEQGRLADSSIFMHLEEEGKDCSQPHPGEEELLEAAVGGKRMEDNRIRREKDDRQPPLDEEGWETAASEGKRMTDSSLWRKKDGRQQHPEGKGLQTAASG